jgi:hypothetical protein
MNTEVGSICKSRHSTFLYCHLRFTYRLQDEYIAENDNIHNYRCENLKSYVVQIKLVLNQFHKSPGSDQIPSELIQAGGEMLRSVIHKLVNSVWNKRSLLWQQFTRNAIKIIVLIIVKYYCYQSHTKFCLESVYQR